MTHYELYRNDRQSNKCHIYTSGYHKDDSGLDLCRTNMEFYIKDIHSLDDAEGFDVCKKCQRIYLMARLAE